MKTTNVEMSISSDAAPTNGAELISITDLLAGINAAGITWTRPSLSEFLSAGDIAEQLGVVNNPRRVFPRDAVRLLVAFLPHYRAGRFKLSQAPDALRAFVQKDTPAPATSELRQLPTISESPAPLTIEDRIRIEEAGRLVQGVAMGRAMAPPAQVMTATEAAAFLRISTRLLRKSVTPSSRFGAGRAGERWTLKDLMVAAGGIDRSEEEGA